MIVRDYHSTKIYGILALLLLTLSVTALSSGPLAGNIISLVDALVSEDASILAATFWQLRLPRVVLALMVGSALAVAGVTMQAIFRNPLAEPGLTGSSSGAALAAATVIVLAPYENHAAMLPLVAFLGALLATLLVLSFPVSAGDQMASLLLLGIAINAVSSAGLGFLSFVADDFALRSLTFWQFGSLGKASWEDLAWATAIASPALGWLLCQGRVLNGLLLGERDAHCLGIDVHRFKVCALLACSVCVGTAVACAGIIGFVGLVVPHLLRLVVGPDHTRLLPASLLAAPALVLAADTLARTVVSPAELPIGILTALLGGPFFIYLLLQRSRTSA
ncbi:FecCD family ABC transporter permease [Litorivivens sp.]|uniref:FecCD family ABC transporter permease n=1 Tax=Litorivivens sp. TaxID=2020868 RepID=UPI003561BBAE